MPTTWLDSLTRQTRRPGGYRYPHQAAYFLNNPLRRLSGDDERAVKRLDLTGFERVLEIGPGPGYFSVAIARNLHRGRLDLLDVQLEMLDKSRSALDRAECYNVSFHSGDADEELPFYDDSFDVAFLASAFGEISDKRGVHPVLASDSQTRCAAGVSGRIPRPGPPQRRRSRELVEADDFEFCDATGNRWHDIVRFRRLPLP
ncbi:Methyltransferase domain-containing protein [Mycobacterium sp. 88mf]|nr:Methyltransferase domain-containing protein [Mycobacterium sp. 88mf]SFF37068.1 Methyltransferase domain-containing protein [Mycobacterium sp. 455mf]